MTRPDEVVAGMHRALVPGGRVVGEMGGQGNVEIITGELVGAMARGLKALFRRARRKLRSVDLGHQKNETRTLAFVVSRLPPHDARPNNRVAARTL